MTITRFLLITLITTAFACSVRAEANDGKSEVVVVTSHDNPITSMNKKELIDLFMGKYLAFSNGKEAKPIDFFDDSNLKSDFYNELVGLPLARVNAYWSRLKFTGRVRPPLELTTLKDIDAILKSENNAVCYVYRHQLNDSMKVVYEFD